jgi:adenylate cyclase
LRISQIQLLLTTALMALAVLLRIADPTPVAKLRLAIYDYFQELAPRTADPSFPVRIVDIDEDSLQRLGQWPWPRTLLAEIVDRLRVSGARVIAVDLILAEPDRLSPAALARHLAEVPELAALAGRAKGLPSNDDRLATAIAEAPVVLGFAAGPAATAAAPSRAGLAHAGDDPKLFAPAFPGMVTSLPALTERAKGLGAINWLPERDQILRRVPLVVTAAGSLYPSLTLETLRVAAGEASILLKSSGGSGLSAFGESTGIESVRVGETVLPTTANGEMWIKFARSDPRRSIPAWRLIDGSFERAEIEGRHILIGASAAGLLDLRATPLEPAVPGVEVHAQALEQMLSGDHLERPAYATGAELTFLVLAGAAIAWLLGRSGPVAAAILGVLSVASVAAASWLCYTKGSLLLDPVYPSLALAALYLTTSLATYIKTESDRAHIRNAFRHYVAAPLVDDLARNPDKLKLGGETREVTLLFADVRGFTSISEGMTAEQLISLVNRIFTPLSEIILEERGTIDKFMGDAVMAFWNAPLPDAAHAANAARTALRMQEGLARLNGEWAREAMSRGENHAPIRIGIGLNTGECVVGNVGSPEHLNYSILGDAVNVASRLEEATKTYGVPIIAGERTAAAAPLLAFIEIDRTAPRGRERPERLFALVGDEASALSERFRALKRAMASLQTALGANDPAAARECLAAGRAIGWPGLEGLYKLYESRIARLA